MKWNPMNMVLILPARYKTKSNQSGVSRLNQWTAAPKLRNKTSFTF